MRAVAIPDRIVCFGRQVDGAGQHVGPPCGRRFHHWCSDCYAAFPGRPSEEAHVRRLAEQARAAGWRIGPRRADGTYPATCDRCSQPVATEDRCGFEESQLSEAMVAVEAAVRIVEKGHS